MKRLMPLLITLLLVMPAQAALLTGGGASFDIGLLYYEPVPAQAGGVLDVWITVENEGSNPARDVTVEILDTYPFTTDSEEQRVKRANSIPAQESYLFKTKVRVDKNADVGTNYLRVRVQQGDGAGVQEQDLAIEIVGQTSTAAITDVSYTPPIVTPGGQTTLSMVVKNIGNTLIRNVEASLDLDDVSLAPFSDSSAAAVEELAGGASHRFEFTLFADPDASPGVYKVPVTLTYIDREGTEKTQSKTIGTVIGSEPELLVYFDSIDLTTSKREGNVVIKIVNKGLEELKLAELAVLERPGVTVTSESPEVYVGNIDEDDYENAELTIKVDNATESVPVRITYRDSLNRPYEERYELPLRLQDGNGEGGINWTLIAIVAIIIVGGAWWYWKKR